MARKTKEEAQKTRETIIDAAIRVFSEQGISRTTLADIASQAGVTRGAIYWHFKNKEDLLSELWEELLLPFENIRKASENPDEPDPMGVLYRTHVDFFNSLRSNLRLRQLMQILLNNCEVVQRETVLHRQRVYRHREGLRIIEQLLKNAILQGQVPEQVDPRLGAIATLAFMDGLLDNWLMFPEMLDAKGDILVLLEGLQQMLLCGSLCRGPAVGRSS